MASPQFAQSFNADDGAVVSFETVGDALGNVDIGVGVVGNKCGVHGESSATSLGTRVVPDGTGVHGRGESNGVVGEGSSIGVLGSGDNRFNQPDNTTGVLGEGLEEAFGVIGLNFEGRDRGVLGHRSGVVGVSNGESERDPSHPAQPLGAGVVGLSLNVMAVSLDVGPRPLPNPTDAADGRGTGVWGASGEGTGVHGQSRNGRGGLFQSETVAQINLQPHFGQDRLPCQGRVGDLVVVTPVPEGERDQSKQGLATLWFCTKAGSDSGNPAVWARVQFDGVATCQGPVPPPPEHTLLTGG